jgi:hypothetical protein
MSHVFFIKPVPNVIPRFFLLSMRAVVVATAATFMFCTNAPVFAGAQAEKN